MTSDPKYSDILENMELLTLPSLKLETLSLDGIPFGSSATLIPPDRLTLVSFAPIVHELRQDPEGGWIYLDAAGDDLEFAQVLDSAISGNGMLHCGDNLTYKITDERIAGFAIYGQLTRRFGRFDSLEQLYKRFGVPDSCTERISCGELLGYDLNYYES